MTGPPVDAPPGAPARRVLIIGSGTYFLSGISYYTHRLAVALHQESHVSVILMRRLIPTRLYPGRRRVGQSLAAFRYPADVAVYDGIDWSGRGLRGALRFLRGERPDVVVLQWWTGAVLHWFIAIAILARRIGARVVVEFHEAQDVGEMQVPLVGGYVRTGLPRLLKLADGIVVHGEFDRALIEGTQDLSGKAVTVIAHGPYDDIAAADTATASDDAEPASSDARTPDVVVIKELLWFGVLRPFKGVEDLVAAFDGLSDDEVSGLRLSLIGEAWEGWTLPHVAAAASRHAERITVVDRYVTDQELAGFLARAHAVVLPYHRSSSSGPLSMAMAYGLPVIVSSVGGLVEAAETYEGAVFFPPGDIEALRGAIRQVIAAPVTKYAAPHSWAETARKFAALFIDLEHRSGTLVGVVTPDN